MNCIIANTNDCSRQGMYAFLTRESSHVSIAQNIQELQCAIHQKHPCIIIYSLPFACNDSELIAAIKQQGAKVIAITGSGDIYSLRQCIHEKAEGIITHCDDPRVLLTAINSISAGRTYRSYSTQRLMELYQITEGCEPLFTEKEKELLQYLMQGYTNEQISRKVYKSERTIENMRCSMMKRTDTHYLAELFIYVLQYGHVQLPPIKNRP